MAEPFDFVIDCFERRRDLGGAWNYDSSPPLLQGRDLLESSSGLTADTKRHHWPTPMYSELHTNIPGRLMEYEGAPFPSEAQLFPPRQTVLRYLRDYGDDVRGHIQFGTEVVRARKDDMHWRVCTRQVETGVLAEHRYDMLLLAHGHYDIPHVPDTPGLHKLVRDIPSAVSHSKVYREPQAFAGKRVIIVGAGPSGQDIANQLVPHAASVHRSSRGLSCSSLDEFGVVNVPEITEYRRDSVTTSAGEQIAYDHIILCTGYRYDIPFLEIDGPPIVPSERNSLDNLYRQLVYIYDPSLAVLTQGSGIVPFPFAQAQACYLARLWSDRLVLPPQADMLASLVKHKVNTPVERLMAFGHPADGHYIDVLRRDCLEARSGGMLPADWQAERSELRAACAELKLRDRRRQRDHDLKACPIVDRVDE